MLVIDQYLHQNRQVKLIKAKNIKEIYIRHQALPLAPNKAHGRQLLIQ